jgi:hypothetical protein
MNLAGIWPPTGSTEGITQGVTVAVLLPLGVVYDCPPNRDAATRKVHVLPLEAKGFPTTGSRSDEEVE